MGISTTAAIIGSTIFGAGASALSSRRQSNAIEDASRTQQQAAQQQIALNRDIYNDQRNLFMPYYQMGLQGMYGGGASLHNLLGLSGPPGPSQGALQPTNNNTPAPQNAFSQYASGNYGMQTPGQQEASQWQAYLDANPDVMRAYQTGNVANSPHLLRGGGRGADIDGDGRISPTEWAQAHYNTYGRAEGRQMPSISPTGGNSGNGMTPVPDGNGGYRLTDDQPLQPVTNGTPAPANTNAPAAPTEGPMTQTLRQTPGYQFLQDESRRAVENSFASRGKLLSGGAIDALNTRTLGIADQTYQQSVNNAFNVANLGLGSAAQIGNAGTNYANMASAAIGNNANAQANARIGQANAFSQGLQGVANAAGAGLGMYGAYRGFSGPQMGLGATSGTGGFI